MDEESTKERVRRRYGDAARSMDPCCVPPVGPRGPADAGETEEGDDPAPGDEEEGTGCCAPEAGRADDPITADLYGEDDLDGLPGELASGSLGCANPVTAAALAEGETVLDLGSGAGLDVLLSARRVGPTGKAYGVDMTDEMLERARANAREAGLENVEFLEGEIEDLPLPDASVDVVISNCVINLSTDKRRTLAEAFRVLRPGGRLAVADMVARGPLPGAVRRSLELWAGCVAGALEEDEYRRLLREAGFAEVEVEPFRSHGPAAAREVLAEADLEVEEPLEEIDGELVSALVRARKPAAGEAAP